MQTTTVLLSVLSHLFSFIDFFFFLLELKVESVDISAKVGSIKDFSAHYGEESRLPRGNVTLPADLITGLSIIIVMFTRLTLVVIPALFSSLDRAGELRSEFQPHTSLTSLTSLKFSEVPYMETEKFG